MIILYSNPVGMLDFAHHKNISLNCKMRILFYFIFFRISELF